MENKLVIPSAIVLAGVLVAGAIIYSGASKRGGMGEATVLPNQENAAGVPKESFNVRDRDFVLGNPSAKIILIEYGDFQCPFCGRFFSTTEKQLKDTYIKEGKAVLVWRDFAFLGQESLRAAEAARCAGEQEKFWQYHDYLFSHQQGENEGAFADISLKKFAKDLGLDTAKFNACFEKGKYKSSVQSATEEGRRLGVNGTPATFVNGSLVSGAVPFATFQKIIEEELKK